MSSASRENTDDKREDKLTRRRRRAERNKMRTIKHIHKLLETFQDGVVQGFSNEGWVELAGVYKQLSPFLATSEFNALGHVWRSTWTQEPDQQTIAELISAIKFRVEGSAQADVG